MPESEPPSGPVVDPAGEWLRVNGTARARLKFEAIHDLILAARAARTLDDSNDLAANSRFESWERNFELLMRALDMISDPYLRGYIGNAVAQLIEQTYVIAAYGPPNHFDAEEAATARKKQTEAARAAVQAKQAPAKSSWRQIVDSLCKPYFERGAEGKTPYEIQKKIRPEFEKTCKRQNIKPVSARSVEDYIKYKFF